MHWKRANRAGQLGVKQTQLPWPENLLRRMEPRGNGCIIYTGALTGDGYGQVMRQGEQVGAHVAAYEHFVGPIPDGMHLHHLCEQPSCVNVEHLRPLTPHEHRLAHRPTHCKQGHEFNEQNRRIRRDGSWYCHPCKMESQRRRRKAAE